jgi:WD40 repeat protein
MNDEQKNPYVGPRTFLKEEGNLFFGRDREARDLLSLVASEQLVLFYAQSGAGKSSLINTRLIPGLEGKKYQVFQVGRVSGDQPPGLEVQNIYVFNLMRSLVQQKINPEILAGIPLSEFLGKLNANESGYFYDESLAETRNNTRRALIIDQFEELFSTHSELWEKRADFFLQLAQAMENDPYLWVILVMREDYIAVLDPYAHLLPSGLRARYYMQRLGDRAAVTAIEGPAAKRARPYAEGVAKKLVDDLSSIRVRKPDDTLQTQAGQYVEPVQLQVVCSSLWERLPADCIQITQKHLDKYVKNVNQALGNYYEERVKAIAQGLEAEKRGVKERDIREWFGRKLITADGIRNMIAQEPGGKSGGLDDALIQDFVKRGDLVREEKRGGATFYEITHDRMVEPIIENNKKWDLENRSPFRQQAEAWKENGKETYLISDQALDEAEQWAKSNQDKLTDVDDAFLEACRVNQAERIEKQTREAERKELEAAQKLANEQARSAKRAWRISLIAISFFVLAMIATVFAYSGQKRLALLSHARELTTQAIFLRDLNFHVSLLLGIEAFRSLDDIQSRGVLLDNLQAKPPLLQYLFGHEASVASIAFSPDGQKLISGGNPIILWDVNTRQPIGQLLTEHKSYVQSVAFSPDGKTLASGGDDNTIILWDSATQQPIGKPLTGHNDRIYSLVFSPDGKVLASGSWDDSIILWDVAKGQPIGKPLLGHTDNVYSVAFSPDGKILASGSLDATIILWDVATQREIGEPLKANNSFVESVAFSPDGKLLASAGYDGTITLWDVATRQQLGLLKGHSSWVSSLAFSPDSKTLVSGSADGTIILWEVATRQRLDKPLKGHSGAVLSVAFSPDGKTFASGGTDKAVILWDASIHQSIGQLIPTENVEIHSVSVSPDGKLFASAGDDSNFTLWNLSTRLPVGSPHPDHKNFVKAVTFSPDGKLLASGGYSSGILLWDIATGQSQSWLRMKDQDKTYDFVYSLAFSPDGKILASGNWEDSIILWDVATQQPIGEPLTEHTPSTSSRRLAVTSLAFSPDGKLLASGSEDNTIILWNVSTRKSIGRLTGHAGRVLSVAFSPDGKTVASGSFDRTIIIWDAKTKQPIQKLTGHLSAVRSVAFSPDGKILASGSDDQTVILWEPKSGQPIGQPITGSSSSVYSLAFTPDGRTLILGSSEIILWNLDPRSWIEESCQIAGHNFTQAEWNQYFPNEAYRKTCDQWPLEQKTTSAP